MLVVIVDGFESLWKVVVEIMAVKEEIINQIDNQDTEIKSYIGNEPGGEGYVFLIRKVILSMFLVPNSVQQIELHINNQLMKVVG
jgi:hypothetical protein